MADIQLLLEAERRGILPADKKELLDEARNRGLVPKLEETKSATPPPQDYQRKPILEQVYPTLVNVGAGMIRGTTTVPLTVSRLWRDKAAVEEQKRQIDEGLRLLTGADPTSTGYAVGKFGGEVAGTAGIGPALAAPVKTVSPMISTALESGGFANLKNVAPKAGVLSRIGATATGGAITGGATGLALSPEDAGTAALFGAALPLGLKPLPTIIGAGQNLYNRLVNPELVAQQTAAEWARKAAGNQLAAIQAANAAQPYTLTSQATADASRYAPPYQTLVRTAEQTTPNIPAQRVRNVQQAVNQSTLDSLAGGKTATERLQSRNTAHSALNESTGATREAALNAADENTQKILELQGQATGARTAAAENVETVRRMASFTDKLNDWARNWTPGGKRPAGAPIPPTEFTYPGELTGRAEETGVKAAQESLTQGEIARNAEASLADMEAKGLKPLSVNNITAQISRTVKNPEIGTNEKLTKALLHIKGMLEDWSSKGGIIDAKALNAIRKNGINSAVDAVAGDLDPEGKIKLAKAVLSNLKPSIDAAIEGAGGKGWREYLAAYTEGSHNIDKQELYGVLADLYSKPNKDKFISLVKGNDPELVHKIFGYGDFDIQKILGDKYQEIANIANQAAKEAGIEKLATSEAGVSQLNEILARQEGGVNKLATLFSPKLALTNKLIEGLQGKVDSNAMKVLQKAVLSGKSMNELLNTASPTVKKQLLEAFVQKGVETTGQPLRTYATQSANQGQQ